jgi:hypothetical protein
VNTRQLVTRARKHLEAGRPRSDADEAAPIRASGRIASFTAKATAVGVGR